ncbi:MAG TPA: sugar phosphate isomerase/epimerase family protein [Allosphingosinicella sp.]|nr:sugar phosphate isomerase/epimerase family protein [Allosphingosinicella sp.]
MEWMFDYAPHIGYYPIDKPLFEQSVGSPDLVRHVEYAASAGFHAILYPWASSRPPEERAAVANALRIQNMRCSCLVYTTFENHLLPLWTDASPSGRARLKNEIEAAMKDAQQLGSSHIAVILKSAENEPLGPQMHAVTANLLEAADLASRNGMLLAVEPMLALPNMLLQSFAEGVDLVTRLGHPSVKLIYDTGHVMSMGEDPLQALKSAFEHICLIQLADMPGRVEPGAGQIDFAAILAYARQQEYFGLIDLEFYWSEPSRDGEQAGLQRLRDIESRAAIIAAASDGTAVSLAGQSVP